MNWRNITTVYLKELKDSLRDRRTLISVIVVPTIVMPLMFLIVGKVTANSVAKARELIYGMPYADWVAQNQTEADETKKAAFDKAFAENGASAVHRYIRGPRKLPSLVMSPGKTSCSTPFDMADAADRKAEPWK